MKPPTTTATNPAVARPRYLSMKALIGAPNIRNSTPTIMKLIERLMGGLLILVGLALITGAFTDVSYWMLETFYAIGLPIPG